MTGLFNRRPAGRIRSPSCFGLAPGVCSSKKKNIPTSPGTTTPLNKCISYFALFKANAPCQLRARAPHCVCEHTLYIISGCFPARLISQIFPPTVLIAMLCKHRFLSVFAYFIAILKWRLVIFFKSILIKYQKPTLLHGLFDYKWTIIYQFLMRLLYNLTFCHQ